MAFVLEVIQDKHQVRIGVFNATFNNISVIFSSGLECDIIHCNLSYMY